MPPKRFQTTAAMACVKILLTIFIVVFWVVGIALLALGIWGVIELKNYLALSDQDYSSVPYVLIGTGSFMVMTGLIGCYAIVKNITWFLHLYTVMVFVVFIALFACGIAGFIFEKGLTSSFKTGLETHIDDYGAATSDGLDKYVDNLQETLFCCGGTNYSEWLHADIWSQEHTDTVPVSCCNKTVDAQVCDDATEKDGVQISNNGTLYIFDEGCSAKVTSFLTSKMGIIAGSALAFGAFQLIGIVLSCCLAKMINANKYEMM
ncbi:tetraspanin-6 [Strongylocentrotus purpuratus]|uniref:Tetraspanin n=1 Tax=Strongylocentrotus purpuratus TaxID=7668 RepID=A0A7M7NK52_STRPU|nr:tetraspanin-6 [Strongylocentrotus purpuratus]|eukprot:XP_011681472.1 PREDICTED: tetraspanin-6 [Strongylocentrotus purpuratus]